MARTSMDDSRAAVLMAEWMKAISESVLVPWHFISLKLT
jgi:hypothetical protein